MKRLNVYVLTILISLLCWSCEKEVVDNEVVYKRITKHKSYLGYRTRAYTQVEYFNLNGYLNKIECQYSDPTEYYYTTYDYDAKNNLVELFDSNSKTITKYIYTNDLLIRRESYDSLNVLSSSTEFEYRNRQIINQMNYSDFEMDKYTKYYYNNGLLDSVVVKNNPTEAGDLPLYWRTEFKYNSSGKIIEQTRFASRYSTNIVFENIEMINKEVYGYDENSNMILYQFTNRIVTGDNKYIFKSAKSKYFYNEYNNLTRIDLYGYDDEYVGSDTVEYLIPVNKKLIIP